MRGKSLRGEKTFIPFLGPESAKLTRVCKTARDTLASPHLVGIVLKGEKDRRCERVCMLSACAGEAARCASLCPYPPFFAEVSDHLLFTGIEN